MDLHPGPLCAVRTLPLLPCLTRCGASVSRFSSAQVLPPAWFPLLGPSFPSSPSLPAPSPLRDSPTPRFRNGRPSRGPRPLSAILPQPPSRVPSVGASPPPRVSSAQSLLFLPPGYPPRGAAPPLGPFSAEPSPPPRSPRRSPRGSLLPPLTLPPRSADPTPHPRPLGPLGPTPFWSLCPSLLPARTSPAPPCSCEPPPLR